MAFLPMFPLKLVVFPKEQLNLHIFEPRYQALVKDCLLFGIPCFNDNKVLAYGTEVELLETTQAYASGESDIKTIGRRRFRILEFYRQTPGKTYGGAEVEFLEDVEDGDIMKNREIISLIEELYDLLDIDKKIQNDPSIFNTFPMGHHVGFSPGQEYDFLKLNTETERQEFMLAHLHQLIPNVIEMQSLQEKVRMNGHFKNLDPLNF